MDNAALIEMHEVEALRLYSQDWKRHRMGNGTKGPWRARIARDKQSGIIHALIHSCRATQRNV
jgi:hypothetical protein